MESVTASAKHLGRCRMCLRDRQELQRSHLIPAGVYRRLRDSTYSNPNPVVVQEGKETQTSTIRLLCRTCEQRLSTFGERWVLKHCLQPDRTFPLLSLLQSANPISQSQTGDTTLYWASRIADINVAALSYFGISMFWRASVWEWPEGTRRQVTLGPFAEEFRLYLTGLRPFPKNASLITVVRKPSTWSAVTHDPAGGKFNNTHRYSFVMPGMSFTLFVGKHISDDVLSYGIAAQKHPIWYTSTLEAGISGYLKAAFDEVDQKRSLSRTR